MQPAPVAVPAATRLPDAPPHGAQTHTHTRCTRLLRTQHATPITPHAEHPAHDRPLTPPARPVHAPAAVPPVGSLSAGLTSCSLLPDLPAGPVVAVARLGPALPALGLDLGHVGAPVAASDLDRDAVIDGGCIHVTCTPTQPSIRSTVSTAATPNAPNAAQTQPSLRPSTHSCCQDLSCWPVPATPKLPLPCTPRPKARCTSVSTHPPPCAR